MSSHYKELSNGDGTTLFLDRNKENYISVGKNGEDISLRFNGKVMHFPSLETLIEGIDMSKKDILGIYYRDDNIQEIEIALNYTVKADINNFGQKYSMINQQTRPYIQKMVNSIFHTSNDLFNKDRLSEELQKAIDGKHFSYQTSNLVTTTIDMIINDTDKDMLHSDVNMLLDIFKKVYEEQTKRNMGEYSIQFVINDDDRYCQIFFPTYSNIVTKDDPQLFAFGVNMPLTDKEKDMINDFNKQIKDITIKKLNDIMPQMDDFERRLNDAIAKSGSVLGTNFSNEQYMALYSALKEMDAIPKDTKAYETINLIGQGATHTNSLENIPEDVKVEETITETVENIPEDVPVEETVKETIEDIPEDIKTDEEIKEVIEDIPEDTDKKDDKKENNKDDDIPEDIRKEISKIEKMKEKRNKNFLEEVQADIER